MHLFLVRHGSACVQKVAGERQLDATGKREINQLAEALFARGAQLTTIYHSGLLRAQETAAILAERLGVLQVTAIRGACPEDDPSDMVIQMASWQENSLLVSHMPYLPSLLSLLVHNTPDAKDVIFHTGTGVCLKREGDQWIQLDTIVPTG